MSNSKTPTLSSATNFSLKSQHGPDVSPPWRPVRTFKGYAVGDIVIVKPEYQRFLKTIGTGPFIVRGINPTRREVWLQDTDERNLGYREPLHWFQKDKFMSAVYRRRAARRDEKP